VILKRGARWIAPGHTSVVEDGAGGWWLIYHAVDSRRPQTQPADPPNSRRVMLMDRIVWIDGWPRIAGDMPSDGVVRSP
jgi:arabinan endo-1,5-alpha-L-arabinosidase